MAIGICVRYRDPAREEEYRPYLTQRHLRDCLWPLATTLGLQRIELLEVLSDYQSASSVQALLGELDRVDSYLGDTTTDKSAYPDWEHVRQRTIELTAFLRELLSEWHAVQEVAFF